MGEFLEPNPYEAKVAREKPRQVILEIGAGGSQSPYLNDDNIARYGDAHLIRTDLYSGSESDISRRNLEQKFGGFGASGSLKQAKEQDSKRIDGLKEQFRGKIDYMSCDAQKMPFGDEAINEVYMANVFSAPGFWQQDRNAILLELKRILKKGGELILAETYTPECALKGVDRDSGRWSFKKALDKYVSKLTSISGLTVKTVEFPKYSKEADKKREQGQDCEWFLSKYPYGKKMFGNKFIPYPTGLNPNYKFIIVLVKK